MKVFLDAATDEWPTQVWNTYFEKRPLLTSECKACTPKTFSKVSFIQGEAWVTLYF